MADDAPPGLWGLARVLGDHRLMRAEVALAAAHAPHLATLDALAAFTRRRQTRLGPRSVIVDAWPDFWAAWMRRWA